MKIYQVADVHLGRRRLEGRLPDQDFADAFRFIAEAAIQDRADVFLVAGDLFDRPQVEPPHLRQAQEVLRLLRQSRIPVIAVEGNHDKLFVRSDEHTWVRFLAEEGLLILLRPLFDAEGAVLAPWDAAACRGAVVDLGGVRFVGAGYLGAATPAKVRQILARLEAGPPHVLLLHAGPDYFVGEGGGFSAEELRALEEAVCYLALGHIHRPMRYGDWACNPGSPEHCELREAGQARRGEGPGAPRGYAVVEIDPAQPARPRRIEVRSNPRRPVHRVELDCTPFGNKTKHGAQALVEAAAAAVLALAPSPDSAIDLRLTGRLNLDRIALDQELAAFEIAAAAGVLAVAVDTTRLNVGTGSTPGGSADDAGISRDELERRAIRDLVNDLPLRGLDGEREQIAGLFFDLKEAVREGRAAEELIARIAASPLVEALQRAGEAAASPPAEGPR